MIVRHSKPWYGMSRHGMAFQDMASQQRAWHCMPKHYLTCQSMTWYLNACHGMSRHVMKSQGMTRCPMSWRVRSKHDKVCHSIARWHVKVWLHVNTWYGKSCCIIVHFIISLASHATFITCLFWNHCRLEYVTKTWKVMLCHGMFYNLGL